MADPSPALSTAQSIVNGWGVAASTGAGVQLDAFDAAQIEAWAVQNGIDGVLWAAVDSQAIVVRAEDAERLRNAHVEAQHRSLRAEATAAEATSLLEHHGISAWLLKGLAAAHLDYPDPALRSSADADLLVRRTDFLPAIAMLARAGYSRLELAPSSRWEGRFGRAATLRSPLGTELDLHASINNGYFGFMLDHDSLLDMGHEPIDLGGTFARGLVGPARLLSSCYMAVLSRGPRLRLWRDIAEQLVISRCDWRAAADLAEASDGAIVLATGLITSARTTRFDPDHPALAWAAGVQPGERAGRAMSLVDVGEDDGWSADARSALLALRRTDQLRFLAGAGQHALIHRRSRGRSLGQQLQRGRLMLRRSR